MSQRRGRPAVGPRPPSNDEPEDVKGGSVTDRRILRSHYRRLKATIAEGKDNRNASSIDEIVTRADDLYSLVQKPREQIADAEALFDITEAFLSSVKESRNGNAVKAADLVAAVIQNFRQPGSVDSDEAVMLDWAAIGSEANVIFHDAPGMCTMLGPMSSEPKKRKATAARKRDKGSASETARPQAVGDEEGDKQSQTDKNIRTMFNVLRRCTENGCELERLVLSRDSFSHTIENIFCLSFLVKDGRAQINIVDGKQFVAFRYAPSAAERSGRADGGADNQVVNSQFVFRFDFRDWMLMKEMVEEGKELMPHRTQAPLPSQTPSTPIRKISRNRGRSETCEITVHLHGGGGDNEDSEAQDEDERDPSLCSMRPSNKRRIL